MDTLQAPPSSGAFAFQRLCMPLTEKQVCSAGLEYDQDRDHDQA
jgi:hypothetical protein